MPKINMENGVSKEDWPNELIVADDEIEKNEKI
jgi:hypothetical protein